MKSFQFFARTVGTSILTLVLLADYSSSSPPAKAFTAGIQQEFEATTRQLFVELDVPGVMVGVWVPGVGTWTRALGVSNRDTREPIQFDQHVRIGSITKTFTTELILLLADEGVLDLSDPISKYVKGVPNGERITLRHLGNMTSGLANYTVDEKFQKQLFANPQRSWKPAELIEIARVETEKGCPQDKKACFAPGTGWYYSNTNTVLLGMVAQIVTKQDYGTALKRRVLEPLRLTQTTHPTDGTLPQPFARGHTIQGLPDGAVTPQDATNWSPSWAFAVGDLVSTFDDLRKWGRAMGSGEQLSRKMRKERFTQMTLPPNVPGTRAYAFGIGFTRGWWGHGGETPGYNSVAYYRSDIDGVIVVITNRDLIQKKDADGTIIDIHPAYKFADAIVEIVNRKIPPVAGTK